MHRNKCKTRWLVCRGGLGDFITQTCRFQNLKGLQQNLIVISGGYYGVPKLMQRYVESAQDIDYITEFVPAYDFVQGHNKDYNDAIQKYVKPRLDQQNDVVQDWRPVDMHDTLQLPSRFKFNFKKPDDIEHILNKKIAVVHPYTSCGNDGGYDDARHWPPKKWQQLCKQLQERDYYVVQIGGQKDPRLLNINLCLNGEDIGKAFYLLQNCHLCLSTNSYSYQISYHAGVPSIVFYYTNPHWASLHMPKESPQNLVIYFEKDIEVGTVLRECCINQDRYYQMAINCQKLVRENIQNRFSQKI